MCCDADLKDLGLPMGPRKKLQMLLKEEQEKRVSNIDYNIQVSSKSLFLLLKVIFCVGSYYLP